jgi:hypothetical protein
LPAEGESPFFPVLCHRNKVHNLKLLSGAGDQPAGLAKMTRRFSVAQGGICFTERTGVILVCTYRDLSKGPVVLCGGKGWVGGTAISRRFWSRRGGILPPGSKSNFYILFLGDFTSSERFSENLIGGWEGRRSGRDFRSPSCGMSSMPHGRVSVCINSAMSGNSSNL